MMKILVIAATGAEIALSIKHIATVATEVKPLIFALRGTEIHFAVTGVGMTATTYHLTKILTQNNYDLLIQGGIAGSFDRNINLGDVVFVQSDCFADLGAKDGNQFINIFNLGLMNPNEHPFTNGLLLNPKTPQQLNIHLPAVTALSVNTVTGSDDAASKIEQQYHCQIESMEGAALHYVCLQENVPFVQIRAISNYVEKRNRATWQIEKAVANLSESISSYLNSHIG